MSYDAVPILRKKVVIDNGETVSSVLDCEHLDLTGIHLGTFTGATITFQASDKPDGTYRAVVDESGSAISITATDDRAIALDAAGSELAAFRYIKFVSASAEGAERTIWCTLKKK